MCLFTGGSGGIAGSRRPASVMLPATTPATLSHAGWLSDDGDGDEVMNHNDVNNGNVGDDDDQLIQHEMRW